MQRTPGLYVILQKDGKIKRTLVTDKGETVLDDTTIGAELIRYAELDYSTYIDSLCKIEEFSEKTEADDPDRFGEVDMDIFDALLTETDELVYGVEYAFPVLGSLLRFALSDHTSKDDGTAMYVYLTKKAICEQIAKPILFYIQLREILHELSLGVPPDFKEKYADLAQGTFTQSYYFSDTLQTEYRFRSTKSYYLFLLLNYLNTKPNVSRCLCCGQYFIPKTRKATSYCDRIIRDGKTCKKIAPTIIHKIAVDTDPVLKAFERTKQKMYKRYERTTWTLEDLPNGISFEEYLNWRESASRARDKYIKGEMTKGEALKIIEVKD